MDANTFIRRWDSSTRNEAAAAKPHFLDLCLLLDVPPPNDDPDGTTYAFEKAVAKANGRKGWADVWRRDCFGWEYKSKGRDLESAHDQLLRYAGALGNPPLLITSDMARIIVQTNFTNTVTRSAQYDLDALRDASVRDRLRDCWFAPERWKPSTTRQAITERAAGDFAELAERLRKRGHPSSTVAHFVNRLVFCLFANDVRLLPTGMLSELLTIAQQDPSCFSDAASMLFRAMKDPGGRIGFRPVPWFNGGLFDDDTALPLLADDISLLSKAAANDWSQIDPSIFGTLFERGLDPDKRSQLGAHYTDRSKIELLVRTVVTQPLTNEWLVSRGEIASKMDERTTVLTAARAAGKAALLLADANAVTAETRSARKDMRLASERRSRKAATLIAEADGTYRAFLARLRAFRVLDPACGSGNFLYVSMLDLKNLELRVTVDAEAMGLEPSFPAIGPEAVVGIEVNPYAAELARVSVWIGHIQWARRHGYPAPSNPVLRKLDTIECRDAILASDGKPAEWPQADAIVGNPPFLGGSNLVEGLGEIYVKRLRSAYLRKVPGGADLVCYWFYQALQQIRSRISLEVGFVATSSIRGGSNRKVLDAISDSSAQIFSAWSDEPWTVSGAAVNVSLICFGNVNRPDVYLDERKVSRIHSDLTSGSADLTTAVSLKENRGVSFEGMKRTGPFDISGAEARAMLAAPANPNGEPNSLVIRQWFNGFDILKRHRDRWIIDFGVRRDEASAAYFALPYAHLSDKVKPTRVGKREGNLNETWWLFARARPALRAAIAKLDRFIVTTIHAKHRIFVWVAANTVPDHALVVIARQDDLFFGLLQNRFHCLWALRMGTALTDRPRYTHSTTLETYPFPTGMEPNHRLHDGGVNKLIADRISRAAARLVEERERWLNPPELVRREPEVAPGYPDRLVPTTASAETLLRKRTLTALYNIRGTPEGAWLDNLHRSLDDAVADAYGWPRNIGDDEALARLLALNQLRSKTS